MFAEPEFNGVADAVDGSIEVHSAAAGLDAGPIDFPLRAVFHCFTFNARLCDVEEVMLERAVILRAACVEPVDPDS